MANLRPSMSLLSKLALGVDPEQQRLLNTPCDPEYPEHRLVTNEWRLNRHIGSAWLAPQLRFVDIANVETFQELRTSLAVEASLYGLSDVDLSAVTSSQRAFTQACARLVFDQGYSGVRYLSRLDSAWECWAVFDTRTNFMNRASPQHIRHDDEDLLAVARLFGFTLETPGGEYLRPWM